MRANLVFKNIPAVVGEDVTDKIALAIIETTGWEDTFVKNLLSEHIDLVQIQAKKTHHCKICL